VSLSVLHEQRVPLSWAVLVALVALLVATTFLPAASTPTTSYQLSYAEEQVITGAGSGWGYFWIAVGVAAVAVGVAMAAGPAAAIIAGTAKAGAGLKVLEGAALIATGLGSIAQGASQLAKK